MTNGDVTNKDAVGDGVSHQHQHQHQHQQNEQILTPLRRRRRHRPSGRSPTTLRPMSAELSSLSRPDGSASLRVGNTHVLCAIHGPTMPRNARYERHDKCALSVAFSRGLIASSTGGGGMVGGAGGGVEGEDVVCATASSNASRKNLPPLPPGLGATERELERFVKDALSHCVLLESYPRCVIQVIVQIVQADGSTLGSAINCALLALLDAGIAMRGVPVATTCAVFDDEDVYDDGEDTTTVWLDPTAEEESGNGNRGIVVLVTNASSASSDGDAPNNIGDGAIVVAMHTFGSPISLDGLLSTIEYSNTYSAPAISAFVRLAIEKKVKREVETLWS
ncbi:hypothetical protein ACHAXA_010425 [Cyclostephanos tholiformis]|uniref:Exoribonuclease phosphorolytic domain-containing protein n=1 Tax=Cyclostephanos tholiformis TaxID=382380 RepID=A0ABD3R3C0_9STRA